MAISIEIIRHHTKRVFECGQLTRNVNRDIAEIFDDFCNGNFNRF